MRKSANAEPGKSEQFYRNKFPKVFNGLGKTSWEYKISLNHDAKPFAIHTPRKVPIPLMEKVKSELDRMLRLGVISKVDEPTEWCAGMVVVPKPNGKVFFFFKDLLPFIDTLYNS